MAFLVGVRLLGTCGRDTPTRCVQRLSRRSSNLRARRSPS